MSIAYTTLNFARVPVARGLVNLTVIGFITMDRLHLILHFRTLGRILKRTYKPWKIIAGPAHTLWAGSMPTNPRHETTVTTSSIS